MAYTLEQLQEAKQIARQSGKPNAIEASNQIGNIISRFKKDGEVSKSNEGLIKSWLSKIAKDATNYNDPKRTEIKKPFMKQMEQLEARSKTDKSYEERMATKQMGERIRKEMMNALHKAGFEDSDPTKIVTRMDAIDSRIKGKVRDAQATHEDIEKKYMPSIEKYIKAGQTEKAQQMMQEMTNAHIAISKL